MSPGEDKSNWRPRWYIRPLRILAMLALAAPGIGVALTSEDNRVTAAGYALGIFLPTAAVFCRRFTLRWVLVCTAILCLALGYKVSAVSRQRSSVAGILAAGGRVRYQQKILIGAVEQRNEDGRDSWIVRRLRPLLGDDWFDDVIGVTLYGDGCRDETLKYVVSLPSLESLALWPGSDDTRRLDSKPRRRAGVTDSGLATLSSLKNLKLISMHGNQVTEEGLKYLDQLPNLKTIQVDGKYRKRTKAL